MPRYTAVLDACVLVPVALADTLLRVAEKGLYRPLWSDRILGEAQAAVEEIHPDTDTAKRFASMREAFDDAAPVTGWEERVPGIRLPDVDDRHVVAAAVQGGAQGIITANIKAFPAAALKPLGLEAVHPDDFLLDQLDLSPPTLLQLIREQAAHSRRLPLAPRDLATLLGRAGVPDFAGEILRLMATPLTAPRLPDILREHAGIIGARSAAIVKRRGNGPVRSARDLRSTACPRRAPPA